MRTTVALAIVLFALTAAAGDREHWSSRECSETNFSFDGRRGYVAQEVVEGGNLRSLSVNVLNGPLAVTGGSTGGFKIVVCKAAAEREDLDRIRVSVVDGKLVTDGPDHDDWSIGYQIDAPNGAALTLKATNGPVSVHSFGGKLVADSTNGPLTLRDLSGEADVTIVNGPVSISGGSGRMTVRATNGPLSVNLAGSSWEAGSLDASTKNGPVTIKLPPSYRPGVMVESSGHGPVSCRAESCNGARLTWKDEDGEEPQTIEIGSGPAVVKVSTVNGPVVVKDE